VKTERRKKPRRLTPTVAKPTKIATAVTKGRRTTSYDRRAGRPNREQQAREDLKCSECGWSVTPHRRPTRDVQPVCVNCARDPDVVRKHALEEAAKICETWMAETNAIWCGTQLPDHAPLQTMQGVVKSLTQRIRAAK
jgi:hypothetical protein